jgi:hypothetical protein
MNWSQPVDSLLDKIRLNAVYLTNRHINNHLYYKNCSKYFEIPTIVLSVFSGTFSVGSDGFLNQELISIVSCSISMLITILTSIKLYMKIQENSTQEQELAVSFKTLALDIFKILSLPEEDRGIDGLIHQNKIYGKYVNLVEKPQILNKFNQKDQLLVIDPKSLITSSNNSLNEEDEGESKPTQISSLDRIS